MKHTDYKSVEIEPFHGPGSKDTGIRWLIGEKDGAENFAMRMIEIDPGGYSPHHTHPSEHECIIWKGSGEVCIGEKKYPISPGMVVFIPSGVEHHFENLSREERLEFICVVPIEKK